VLLLHANEVVSRDQLIDALWGERLPPSAAESLDAYVYRLRKLLGHDRLPRERSGYLLRVGPGELDVDEFERLVARAGQMAANGAKLGLEGLVPQIETPFFARNSGRRLNIYPPAPVARPGMGSQLSG
jgi:DNA-binding SARP family transcriptional activator